MRCFICLVAVQVFGGARGLGMMRETSHRAFSGTYTVGWGRGDTTCEGDAMGDVTVVLRCVGHVCRATPVAEAIEKSYTGAE